MSARDIGVTPKFPSTESAGSLARTARPRLCHRASRRAMKTFPLMAFPPVVLTVVCSMLDNRVLAHRPTASHLEPNTHAPPAVRDHTGAEAERTARRPALSDGAMPFALRV